MSRKSIILCLSVLAVLLLGLGVAIAVLYADVDRGGNGYGHTEATAGVHSCIAAIPSDAVMLSFHANAGSACRTLLSSFPFPSLISEKIQDGTLASVRKAPMAVSLHYVGKLHGLYVIDIAKVTDESVSALENIASEASLHFCKTGSFVLMSKSETLVKSSARHLDKGVSIADAPGFPDAASAVSGKDVLLVSNLHARKFIPSFFAGNLAKSHSFVERVSDWMVFGLGSDGTCALSMAGKMLYDGDAEEFMTVFKDCVPSVSEVAAVLPDYTLSSVSLPIKNLDEYISAYHSFVDTRQGLQSMKTQQKEVGKKSGIMPEDMLSILEVKEIAQASISVRGNVEKINLMRVGARNVDVIFKGNDVKTLKNYKPAVHTWAYPSALASVFGRFFALKNESFFTYVDGWVVTGSMNAVNEYVSENALDYTLEEYLSDAGVASLLNGQPSLLQAYVSFTKNSDRLGTFLGSEVSRIASSIVKKGDCVPAVFSITKDKKSLVASFDVHSLEMKKSKAPSQDRDTVVVVPSGPFKVKNSGTGKMNTFYQNSKNAICLRDETGKDLWGVPLGKPICGTAHNVDYYANGKQQIVFGAGSSVYMIDRLGRYVSGFPVDLGKEILVGPDVYDFSGAKKYNIMVLHKDKTIQMYNLKGKKPDAWKGISAPETIKALPARLTLGGKDFWVVRTSVQTLIYPFYGGEPLTVFAGDEKIRPDSEIKAVDNSSVQFTCYDGKSRTLKLN